MKCQIQISGRHEKNIINVSSAELAQRLVKIKFVQFQVQGRPMFGSKFNFRINIRE